MKAPALASAPRSNRMRLLKQVGSVVTMFGLSLGTAGYLVAAHRATSRTGHVTAEPAAPTPPPLTICPKDDLKRMPTEILARTPYPSREALQAFVLANKSDWNRALDSLRTDFEERAARASACVGGDPGRPSGKATLTFDLTFAGAEVTASNFAVYKAAPSALDTARTRACFARHFNAKPLMGRPSSPLASHYRGASAYPLQAQF